MAETKDQLPKEPEAPAQASVTTRDSAGRFLPGTVNSPGRPPKLEIGDIQLHIEKAVRKHFPAERIIKVVEATFVTANRDDKEGIACRKLIFEYFIQKPKMAEEESHTGQSITIKIENATFKAQHDELPPLEGNFTEVKSNG